MQPGGKLKLGTRGSELARAQACLVAGALREAAAIEVEMVLIKTTGDERPALAIGDLRAGRKGMFTREIENALSEGRIDFAVHSAKDLPSEMDATLVIAAVLARASVEDVLVTRNGESFQTLAPKSTIATGSIRRRYQIQAVRPDLVLTDLRGNVPTRLRKFLQSDWSGIILARAGLERLGFGLSAFQFEAVNLRAESLPIGQFVPAGGQGIIALQARAEDKQTRAMLARIDDCAAHRCLGAEREFLRLLQVDCNAPVGVHATIADEQITMTAQLFEPTYRLARATGDSPIDLAKELFSKLNG